MANKTLNVRIQNKYDTEANWASKNPVLLKGEAAYSSDKNGLYKIGDGTSKWSDLKYNSANTLVNHTSGEGFEFGYANSKTITIPKTTAVTTYYIQIAQKANFRFKNYYVKTSGNNTQYSFQAEISANAYMEPHVTLNTQKYNDSEVKSILICKNSTNSYHHDIYLVVNSSTSVAKTIYIWSDNTILDTVSTTAPTTATELNVNITNDSYIYTSKKIQANITGSAGSVAWGNITGKPSTYYTHPSYTARSSGLYKVTVDATGHVSGATAVSKADITALGIPGTDTNTWRGVQNNLTSTATDQSLSAAQGKILNELTFQKKKAIDATVDWDTLKEFGCYKIQMASWGDAATKHSPNAYGNVYQFGLLLVFRGYDADTENRTVQIYIPHMANANVSSVVLMRMLNGTGWQAWHPIARGTGWSDIINKPTTFTPSSHTHDDRYYTESEINSKLAGYLPLSGGTLTGNLNLKPASGEGGEIHLDASTANRTENGIILDQQGGNFRIFGVPSADGTTKTGSGTPLVINPYSKTITGGYTLTGALSGNASTATALTTSAGSSTQPIYFSSGKPVATTYQLNASVPAGAKFTDTNTWRPVENVLTSTSTSNSLSAAQGKVLKDSLDQTNAKVNNIQIGGRNLARGTSSDWSGWITPPNNVSNNTGVIASIYPGAAKSKGDTFTVSFDIDVKKFTQSSGGTFQFYLQGAVDEAWTAGNPFTNYNFRSKALNGDYTEHVTYTCQLANNAQASATKFTFGYRCDYSNGTGKFRIRNLKVERGNKATDWSPAPEDYLPLNGNASTASKWATARTLTLTGSVTGSVSIDGSGNVSLATSTNHTHSQYYDSGISRAANTVLAAPNGANGTATFRKLVAADIPTLTKSKISDFPTSLAPTAGSNNYVRVYNSKDIGNSSTVTFNDLAKQHFAMGMINGATDNPYGAAKWAHGISMAWSNGANTSWISQIALGVQEGTGMWYRTSAGSGTIVGRTWNRVLDSSNYSSYAATKGHTHDLSTMINTLTTGTSAPTDSDYYVTQYAGGGTTTTSYHRRPHSALWTYIKSKADAVYQPKGSYAAANHTHNYAGSSSAGGAATSANKLNTNAGSATQPVYFSGGVPVACTHTLGKSVPADAKFTDTNTWRGIQDNLTSSSASDSLSANQGRILKGLVDGKAASGHTHNYAGSSSAGGSANSAVKLATARTVSGGTDITMSFNYDGSANSSANIGFYGSAANVGDKNNYPFHRFAKLDTITGGYTDKASTFYISQDYNGGGFGIVRIVLRTNNSSSVSSVEVKWLVRCGLNADSVQVGLYNVFGKTYADAFFKTGGSYAGTYFRAIANGGRATISRTWVMVNSSEVSGTTTTDAKTSTECYVTIAAAGTKLHKQAYTNIVSGSDSGTVSYSNSTGSASTSTKLTTARNIFGKSFNGTADVAGQGLFYGTYTSTASNRFSNSGLQIRENGLVGKNQTDIGYAPTIGFHWSNRIAATLAFGSDGIFYFRKQNGTDRATIDANVNGNASSASSVAWANVSGKPAIVNKTIKSLTSASASGWTNLENAQTLIPDMSVIAYWNGAYSNTSSNLAYCNKGAFGTIVTKNAGDYATAGHTHHYAGSSSAGGSATSAVKLDTSTAGSATQPVYFTGGKPVACTYTLGKSVPSNAVFTDTNNKMTQTAIASKDYTNWRTILWGASNSGTEGFTPTTVTDGAFTDTNLSYQPSTGTLRAKVFKGDLYQTTTIGNSTATECSLNFLSNAKLSDGSYLAQNYRIVNDRKTDFVFGIKTKNNEWASYCQGTQVYFKNSSADISALAGKMLPPVLTDFSGSKDSPGAGTGRVLSIASNVDSKIIKFRIFTSSTATTATTVNVTYSTSDIRLKDNVKDTDIKDALSVINKMKIRQFDWKDDNKHQKIGFVADELEELDDKLVVGGGWEDEEHTQMNVKGVDTFYMMGYVVKGMQELSEQIKALTEENKELKKQIEGLKREG